jgi:hypothetical protein
LPGSPLLGRFLLDKVLHVIVGVYHDLVLVLQSQNLNGNVFYIKYVYLA